ncbi:hypothetical protein [Geodermatophilus sp. CPCC 205506]|uniref:hypothetical protein n=1 Tax=Geodermatophilus sp. CPCC 205506 TaxID=2936596 RepID=UPI003EEC8438
MHEVRERVEKLAEELAARAEEADALGCLPDDTAEQLRAAGVVRLLQPVEYAGFEASPVEFFETVLAVGARSAAAGWVSGVVGVHPFEIAQADRRVQDEIWGLDPDTWVASPYAPFGRARRVEGGYRFSGRWPFSSGTDHCEWVVLGGLLVDDDGRPQPPEPFRHFVLPRRDYEVLHDSWQVMGLQGSGSKDVVIRDAFVPDHRVIDPADLREGRAAQVAGRGDVPLYRMPNHTMFASAIIAATLAMAEGAVAHAVAHLRMRPTAAGRPSAADLGVLGAATADVAASRVHFLADIQRMYDVVCAGGRVDLATRVEIRRNQVRASRRAVDAVDRVFAVTGGGGLRSDNPLQRYWRDLHAGMNHICNVADPMYDADGRLRFGHPLPPGLTAI